MHGRSVRALLVGLALSSACTRENARAIDGPQPPRSEASGAAPTAERTLADVSHGADSRLLTTLIERLQSRGLPKPRRGWAAIVSVGATLAEGEPWEVSRIGGNPLLPAGTQWPTFSGKPMVFLAQLDMGELRSILPDAPLPKSGGVAFFAYFDPPVNEFGTDYLFCFPRDRFVGLEIPAGAELVQLEFPPELPAPYHFAARPMRLAPIGTVIDSTSPEVKDSGWTAGQIDAYVDEEEAADPKAALVLGNPRSVQWDVRLDWEACDDESRALFELAPKDQLRAVEGWLSLATWEFGKHHRALGHDDLYIGIMRDDAVAGRWSKARLILQGS